MSNLVSNTGHWGVREREGATLSGAATPGCSRKTEKRRKGTQGDFCNGAAETQHF